jgi:hypothetical protein
VTRRSAIPTFVWGLGLIAGIGFVSWIAGTVSLENPSALFWIFITLVLCCVAITISVAREGDPLSPLVIVPVAFIVLYVFRPLYILGSGRWGPTAAHEDHSVTSGVIPTMTHASRLVAMAVVVFVIGYLVQRATRPLRPKQWLEVRGRLRRFVGPLSLKLGPTSVLVALTFVLAVYAYGTLIREAGGISAYISQLSARSGYFFGRSYLTTVSLPLKVVTLLIVSVILMRSKIPPSIRIIVIGLTSIVVVGDFLTGGRAALLTGTLLPVVLLWHYERRPLRLPALTGLIIVALLIFIVIRVVTRDAVYQGAEGRTTSALIQDAVLNIPKTTVGGQDAIPYDSLMVLVEANAREVPLELGSTYLPILTFPVPRSIWPSKPLGGGDVWFTKKYFPLFYGKTKTEASVSLLGESFANFGLVGVALIMFAFGFGLSALYGWFVRSSHIVGAVAYAITFGYAITLLRGDAFHSVTSLGLTLGLLVITTIICTGSVRAVESYQLAEEATA